MRCHASRVPSTLQIAELLKTIVQLGREAESLVEGLLCVSLTESILHKQFSHALLFLSCRVVVFPRCCMQRRGNNVRYSIMLLYSNPFCLKFPFSAPIYCALRVQAKTGGGRCDSPPGHRSVPANRQNKQTNIVHVPQAEVFLGCTIPVQPNH